MIKYRMIFSYYVLNEVTEIHKLHLNLIRIFGPQFNNIDFILNIDDPNNNELIEYTKNTILELTNLTNINFIVCKNNPEIREGNSYIKYFIDRLNEFSENELIFFGHTKGLTSKIDDANVDIENIKEWIKIMYWENLYYLNYVDQELIEHDNICFGSIYCYDKSNYVKYHWQYTGSFYWVNPQRLLKILNDNNFNYNNYTIQQCRNIAEELLGNYIDVDKVSFIDHELYNKHYCCVTYDNSNYPYFNIRWIAFNFLHIDKIIDYNNFNNEYKI